MSQNDKQYDVIVVGAGVGGVCAAVASARAGARTLLLEKDAQIGGTGVHSPVSLVCKFHGTDHRPINLGIHRELFFEIYRYSTRDMRDTTPRLTYDEAVLLQRYQQIIADEPNLTLRTSAGVDTVHTSGRRVTGVVVGDSTLGASVFVDSTADGNLSAMAGAAFEKGRPADGRMQSATLVFGLSGFDPSKLARPDFWTRGGCNNISAELTPYYKALREAGGTSNVRSFVLCFPYPDRKRLLFNSTAILDVDPTDESSIVRAVAAGRRQVEELVGAIRQHAAFSDAKVEFVASKLGVREGRRIIGDYMLTQEDCLGEARFDDMVAACAYELDIHDPEGGPTRMVNIPGSGYYHIPYRCLTARDFDNLLLGSRCISGTHEAHSSYRVMSGVSAIGQAAGTAAAIAATKSEGDVRAQGAEPVRKELRRQVQFVE